MQSAKGGNIMLFGKETKWTVKEDLAYKIISGYLNHQLNKYLREEMSGTYGVQVKNFGKDGSFENYQFQIMFESDPATIKEMNEALRKKINDLVTVGISSKEFKLIKSEILKDLYEGKNQNDLHKYQGIKTRQLIDVIEKYQESGTEINIESMISDMESIDLNFINGQFQDFFNNCNSVDYVYMPI